MKNLIKNKLHLNLMHRNNDFAQQKLPERGAFAIPLFGGKDDSRDSRHSLACVPYSRICHDLPDDDRILPNAAEEQSFVNPAQSYMGLCEW